MSSRLAIAALVVANLVPLAGVVAFGWSLFDVMLIYWLENGVIGLFNLLRMATAGEAPGTAALFGPFFTVHYGTFWFVHGVFVVALFGPGGWAVGAREVVESAGAIASFSLPIVGAVPLAAGVGWAVASVALSHGVSFVRTWWLGGERRGVAPATLMARPYARVMVLHATLLAGGLLVARFGRPVLALALMVVLKIGVDVAAHLREHRAPRPAPAVAADVSSARAR